MPASANVMVIINPGTTRPLTLVPVSELAQILKGRNPAKRPGLWEPASGFWIRIQADWALALDQAYRP